MATDPFEASSLSSHHETKPNNQNNVGWGVRKGTGGG